MKIITIYNINKLNASQKIFKYTKNREGKFIAILKDEPNLNYNSNYREMLKNLNSDGSDEDLLVSINSNGEKEYYAKHSPKIVNVITKTDIQELNTSQTIFHYYSDKNGKLTAKLVYPQILPNDNGIAFFRMLDNLNCYGYDDDLVIVKDKNGDIIYQTFDAPKIIKSLKEVRAELERLKLHNEQVLEVSAEILDKNFEDDEKVSELCLIMVLFKSHSAKAENLAEEAKESFKSILKTFGWSGGYLDCSDGDGSDIYKETIKILTGDYLEQGPYIIPVKKTLRILT